MNEKGCTCSRCGKALGTVTVVKVFEMWSIPTFVPQPGDTVATLCPDCLDKLFMGYVRTGEIQEVVYGQQPARQAG